MQIVLHPSEFGRNVDNYSVDSPRDGAVFYCGRSDSGVSNRLLAKRYVAQAPSGSRVILNDTEGGRALEEQPRGMEKTVGMVRLSDRYAKMASGGVTCFASKDNYPYVFRDVEFPQLLNNQKVTSLNGIPREELLKKYNYDRHTAYSELVASSRKLSASGTTLPESKMATSISQRPLSREAAAKQRTRDTGRQRGISR